MPGYLDDNSHRSYPPPPDGPPVAEGVRFVRPPDDGPDGADFDGWAVTSVGCGILGLFVLQIVLAPVAIVLGAIGTHTAKDSPAAHRMAVTGYVLGVVDALVWLFIVTVFNVSGFPL